MSSTIIPVVFNLEADPIDPIGTYTGMEEDMVLYRDPYGFRKMAPADCVKVVDVNLFPEAAQILRCKECGGPLEGWAGEHHSQQCSQDVAAMREP